MATFRIWSLTALVLGALLSPAEASDPIGVYALVDKVVYEPNESEAVRVQIWGAFSVSQGHGRKGQYYHPPVRGYLYCSLNEAKAEMCRNEWKDLKRAAEQKLVVGFGSRYEGAARVRRATEAPEKADPYTLGFGVRLLEKDHGYYVARRLRRLPVPVSPTAGAKVDPGDGWRRPVQLVLEARNCLDSTPETHYLFELECDNGEIIASPPIKAGEGKTGWEAPVMLHPGHRYQWRVRIVGADSKQGVPVATSHFIVKSKASS